MTEKLSSLMDGELAADEAQLAIQECCSSEKSKIDWHLYHVIGDAMRGHAPKALAFPDEVMAALKEQPTVLAPRRRAPSMFTRVALAAAASVATVGVVGWMGSQGGQGSAVPMAAKSNSGIQPASNTVALPQQGVSASDVQTYLDAHRQLPTRELYRPVNNRAPASATR